MAKISQAERELRAREEYGGDVDAMRPNRDPESDPRHPNHLSWVIGKKAVVLYWFRRTGALAIALKRAGIGRARHASWLREDQDYEQAFNSSQETVADVLEAEAMRRAVSGTNKPIYFKGDKIDTVKEYSDVLLMFLLKGARPEKYRERFDVSNTAKDMEKLAATLGVPVASVIESFGGAPAAGLEGSKKAN